MIDGPQATQTARAEAGPLSPDGRQQSSDPEATSPPAAVKRATKARRSDGGSSTKTQGRKRKRPDPDEPREESTRDSTAAPPPSPPLDISSAPQSEDDADELRARARSGKKTMQPAGTKTSRSHRKDGSKGAETHREDDEGDRSADKAQTSDDADEETVEKDEGPPPPASESEMSVLLDEEPRPPRPKKTGRKSSSSAPRSKTVPKAKGKAKTSRDDASLDPQEVEIKRLQSWLLKCGVRKAWHRELARFPKPSAKINHLKDMLKDLGMAGRFSADKARRIKEERELRAEVLAVQESAKRWGEDPTDEDESEQSGGPRQGKLAKGLKDLEFENDGEETD